MKTYTELTAEHNFLIESATESVYAALDIRQQLADRNTNSRFMSGQVGLTLAGIAALLGDLKTFKGVFERNPADGAYPN